MFFRNGEGVLVTRYCPSIEDRYFVFGVRELPAFLEPEGRGTEEVYIQGLSAGFEDVQRLVRSARDLCWIDAELAVGEYDMIITTSTVLSKTENLRFGSAGLETDGTSKLWRSSKDEALYCRMLALKSSENELVLKHIDSVILSLVVAIH